MATTKAKASSPVKNNGGIVPRGGNVSSNGPVTASDTLTQGYQSKGVGGTGVVQSSNLGTGKAVTGATFAAQMASGKYVMMRYGYVGGNASSFLNSAAGDFGRRAIHYKENRRSYHITSWNYQTGAATKGAETNDSFGQDHAARPTRAIPGEFVFTDHGLAKSSALAVPLMDDYEAKTG